MRIEYDHQEDILMIELVSEGIIDHAEQSGSMILHLSDQHEPVLLEIFNASDFLATVVRASLRSRESCLRRETVAVAD